MPHWKKSAYLILHLLLLLTCITVFIPFAPGMPTAGLDPSWIFGMNHAVSEGMRIGDDVIFTFGPYASVYTRAYHPQTDSLMLFGGSVLAITYWTYLSILTKDKVLGWALIFSIVALALIRSFDIIFYSTPLLLGCVVFKSYHPEGSLLAKKQWSAYLTGLLFLPLGLLPVIKGSMLVICVAVAGLCILYFIYQRLYREALAAAIAPVMSMGLLWLLSGQDIWELIPYSWNILQMVAGYTEAMAIDGSRKEIAIYAAAATALLFSISAHDRLTTAQKLFLSTLFFVFLFLAFKAGFVRHDGHALAAGGATLLATILVCWLISGRFVLIAGALCLFSWWYIESNHVKQAAPSTFKNASMRYATAWRGMTSRLTQPDKLQVDFARSIATLKESGEIPLLPGTSDIYSHEQSYLISSGNNWSPRPIFQSYAAYTPYLIEKNRKHLQGRTAPDNVFFGIQPIDGRFPSLEDGASWLALLSGYQPVSLLKTHLLLKKTDKPGDIQEKVIYSGAHGFGEEISIPKENNPLFVRLAIKKTMLGNVVSTLYKPGKLFITVILDGGESKKYRLISGMTHSPFLLSPLIEGAEEFSMLYGPSALLSGKRVKSFSVSTEGTGHLWESSFNIELTSITMTKFFALPKPYNLKSIDYSLSSSGVMASCAGGIDLIAEGKANREIDVSGLLNISGWLASSVSGYSPEETAYIVLHREGLAQGFVSAKSTARLDVANHFKTPTLESSGFNAKIDISEISGDYKIGLAIERDGKLKTCPTPNILIHVKN